MHKILWTGIAMVIGGLLCGTACADTYELADGQTVSGDVVSFNENGLVFRQPDDKYSDRVPWAKFSQEDLKKLGKNPKIAPLVDPFIEVSEAEKEMARKAEIQIRMPDRLKRPEAGSLLGALFSSSIGGLVLLVLYAANVYAAYEVSVFRAQPRVLVCGLAAIPFLGILSTVVFVSLPTRPEQTPEETVAPEVAAATAHAFSVPGTSPSAQDPASAAPGSLRLSTAEAGRSTSSLPVTQVFQRGAYTFNRRFFETKFPTFFAMIRRDADKDMVLLVKSARGEFVGQRISRIAANDLHIYVQRGAAGEEIQIPFTEIQEIHLKHKDA